MNGTRDSARVLVKGLISAAGTHPTAQVILFPPALFLADVKARLEGTVYQVGAQDISPEERGAFTGDLSAEMLLSVGGTHVLVGHSERRQIHQESDQLIGRKLYRALQAGLTPVLCIGELLAERESGRTRARLESQLAAALAETAQLPKPARDGIIIAYEPVWAIGTGRVATPDIAAETHGWIAAWLASQSLRLPILYGGSVNKGNAAELLAAPGIDGVLVGGASLKAEEFAAIIAAGGN